MLSLSAIGLVRFDVEDFLTPESDVALESMLESMERWGVAGSYGLVGKKALALEHRRQRGSIARLQQERALGFHSLSHSEHPTIAEELSLLSYEEARQTFRRREGEGAEVVARVAKPPVYFTQPGGNWVPEAADVLPDMGMPIYFSDAWNSYLRELSQPYWYGRVLHLSPPVMMPRPFLLGMPENLEEAGRAIEIARARYQGGIFMVMLHPTELVTHEFWDAVNFKRGGTRDPLISAPVRSMASRAEALAAFDRYVERLSQVSGVEWMDVVSLSQRVAPREGVKVGRLELVEALRSAGLGPLECGAGTLSAGDALWALSRFVLDPKLRVVEVGEPVAEPLHWTLSEDSGHSLSAEVLAASARLTVRQVEKSGHLPDNGVKRLPLETLAGALWRELSGHRYDGTLPASFVSYVRTPDEVHWDWPIFPEGFQPMRLWEDARRLAWSLKRASWKNGRDNDARDTGA